MIKAQQEGPWAAGKYGLGRSSTFQHPCCSRLQGPVTCAVTQGPVLRRTLLGSKLCCHHSGTDNNFSKRAPHLILRWTLQITKLVLPVAIPFMEDWPRLPSRTRLPFTRESPPPFPYLSSFDPRLLESDDKNLTEKPRGTPSFTLYMFTGVFKKTPQTLLCWGLGLQTVSTLDYLR